MAQNWRFKLDGHTTSISNLQKKSDCSDDSTSSSFRYSIIPQQTIRQHNVRPETDKFQFNNDYLENSPTEERRIENQYVFLQPSPRLHHAQNLSSSSSDVSMQASPPKYTHLWGYPERTNKYGRVEFLKSTYNEQGDSDTHVKTVYSSSTSEGESETQVKLPIRIPGIKEYIDTQMKQQFHKLNKKFEKKMEETLIRNRPVIQSGAFNNPSTTSGPVMLQGVPNTGGHGINENQFLNLQPLPIVSDFQHHENKPRKSISKNRGRPYITNNKEECQKSNTYAKTKNPAVVRPKIYNKGHKFSAMPSSQNKAVQTSHYAIITHEDLNSVGQQVSASTQTSNPNSDENLMLAKPLQNRYDSFTGDAEEKKDSESNTPLETIINTSNGTKKLPRSSSDSSLYTLPSAKWARSEVTGLDVASIMMQEINADVFKPSAKDMTEEIPKQYMQERFDMLAKYPKSNGTSETIGDVYVKPRSTTEFNIQERSDEYDGTIKVFGTIPEESNLMQFPSGGPIATLNTETVFEGKVSKNNMQRDQRPRNHHRMNMLHMKDNEINPYRNSIHNQTHCRSKSAFLESDIKPVQKSIHYRSKSLDVCETNLPLSNKSNGYEINCTEHFAESYTSIGKSDHQDATTENENDIIWEGVKRRGSVSQSEYGTVGSCSVASIDSYPEMKPIACSPFRRTKSLPLSKRLGLRKIASLISIDVKHHMGKKIEKEMWKQSVELKKSLSRNFDELIEGLEFLYGNSFVLGPAEQSFKDFLWYKIFTTIADRINEIDSKRSSKHQKYKQRKYEQFFLKLYEDSSSKFQKMEKLEITKSTTSIKSAVLECLMRWKMYFYGIPNKIELLLNALEHVGLYLQKELREVMDKHRQISSRDSLVGIDDKSLQNISQSLLKSGDKWKILGTYLDYSSEQMESFTQDTKGLPNGVYRMIIDWRNTSNGSNHLKFGIFSGALVQAGFKDLARGLV